MVYIALAFLIFVGLMFAAKAFAGASADNLRTAKRVMLLLGGVGLLIVALRLGQTQVASAIGIFMLLSPLFKRAHTWLTGAEHTDTPPVTDDSPRMTTKEAAAVLNIPETATSAEIRAAHKTLIRKNHPDQGGSDYLAGKINQARDVLLKSTKAKKK